MRINFTGSKVCLVCLLFALPIVAKKANTFFDRTEIVSPAGNAIANGVHLVNALNSITGATVDSPWLIKIEPGIYDIGLSSLAMKPYVDVEGSGEGITTIIGHGATTVQGASNSELRFLTIANTGVGATDVAALLVDGIEQRGSHLTVIGSMDDTDSYDLNAILIRNGGVGDFDNLVVQVAGGYTCSGISLMSGGSLELRDAEITIAPLSGTCNAVIGASTAGTSAGNISGLTVQTSNVFHHAVVAGPGGMIKLENSHAINSASDTAIAVMTVWSGSVDVHHSRIDGSVAGAGVRLGATQINGTVLEVNPAPTCVACYDGNFDPLESNCRPPVPPAL